MKHAIKSILAGGTLLAATSAAQAELETEIHGGYHSIYEFRGVDLGDDLLEAGIDLSYDLGSGWNISGGIWYGDTDGNSGISSFDEVDYYIGVTKTLGSVDLSVGYIYYDFPGDTFQTEEIYFGLSTEIGAGIGLSATYYWDYDDSSSDTLNGEYLEVELSKSWELSPCVNLDVAVGAAYSFDYNTNANTGDSLDGFNHYFVSVAAPWSISESFTLTPYIKFVGAGDKLLNDLEDGDSEDLFLGGLTLSYSF